MPRNNNNNRNQNGGYTILSTLVTNGFLHFKKSILNINCTVDLKDLESFIPFTKAFSSQYSVNTRGKKLWTNVHKITMSILCYLSMP